MSLGKSISCDTLNEFINKECQEFPARAIRLNTRKIINFNTLISKEETMYDKHYEAHSYNQFVQGRVLFSFQRKIGKDFKYCLVYNQ